MKGGEAHTEPTTPNARTFREITGPFLYDDTTGDNDDKFTWNGDIATGLSDLGKVEINLRTNYKPLTGKK